MSSIHFFSTVGIDISNKIKNTGFHQLNLNDLNNNGFINNYILIYPCLAN